MSRHRPHARSVSPQILIALVVVAALAALFALSSALRDRSTAGPLGANAANTGGLPALATVGSPGEPSWQPAPAVVAAPPVTVAPPTQAARHVAKVVPKHPAPLVTGVVAIPDVAAHSTVLVVAPLPAGTAVPLHSSAPVGPGAKAATLLPIVRTTVPAVKAPVLKVPTVKAPVVKVSSSKPVVAAAVKPVWPAKPKPTPAAKSSSPTHQPTLLTPVTGVLGLVSTVLKTVLGGLPHGH